MNYQTEKINDQPDCYIRMEQSYREAVCGVLLQKQKLRAELYLCREQKQGDYASALYQKQLEQRIQLLTDEYGELCEVLRAILPYARRQEEACGCV